MQKEEKSYGPPAVYMLSGVAIGAALGLLFAPKKGSELRDDLAEFGRRNGEKGRQLYARVKEMIPTRFKAAGAVGAAQGMGAEALEVAQEEIGSTRRH